MSEIYRQFEGWWSKDKSQFTEDDELKEFAWVIWQASREAIEVELPSKITEVNWPHCGHVLPEVAAYDEAIEDCADAIRAAGLKVKGES